ncbi:hypothetical protein D3C71_1818950 [compost metagenome]
MCQPHRKAQRIGQPVEAVGHFIGGLVIHIANESQGNVIILRIDPAGAAQAAPLEGERKSDIGRDFKAGKEPGHGPSSSSGSTRDSASTVAQTIPAASPFVAAHQDHL